DGMKGEFVTDRASGTTMLGQQTGFDVNGRPPDTVVAGAIDYTLNVAGQPLRILRDCALTVAPGEIAAIVGPSGSGKTSLLMLLAGLERPTSGTIRIAGEDLGKLNEDGLAQFRRRHVGIVFQSFHLIPSLSALDNVCLPLEIAQPDKPLGEVR